MDNREFDYKYSLDLLKRLNEAVYKNKDFHSKFIFKDYDLWHSYQMSIFAEIKQYSKYGDEYFYDFENKKIYIKIKNFILRFILFFVSLISILILIVKRKKVLIYSIDKTNSKYKSDSRIEGIYDILNNGNFLYAECFHTLIGRDFIVNLLKRRRFSMYIEGFDFLNFHFFKKNENLNDIIYFDNFSKKERRLIEFLCSKYLNFTNITKFRVAIFSGILKMSSVKVLFSIDDVRHYNELLLACNINNIDTYALQHGHFTKYHVGWLFNGFSKNKIIKPDRILVWSNYWKNEILNLRTYFDFHEIDVVKFNKIIEIGKGKDKHKDGYINILIPYESDAPKNEVMNYIKVFLELNYVNVFFKVRSDLSRKKQLKEYGIDENFNDRLFVVSDIVDIINDIDIVAGVYSTFLYDMILNKKPVILLKTSMDYGYRALDNNLVGFLDLKQKKLFEVLLRVKNLDYKILLDRKRMLLEGGVVSLKEYVYRVLLDLNIKS